MMPAPCPFRHPSPAPIIAQAQNVTSGSDAIMAFYELRQYKVLPGRMDGWVKMMEQEIIPFQVSLGMVITGSYRGETDDSVYVWLRRFESEAERETLYKAVYESDHWKNNIAPRVPEYLDRSAIVVTRIVPTPKSVAH
jgi:hypothetical protein